MILKITLENGVETQELIESDEEPNLIPVIEYYTKIFKEQEEKE